MVTIRPIHRVYATVIIRGDRTFASVPDGDKDAVRAALLEKGYEIDAAGNAVPFTPTV